MCGIGGIIGKNQNVPYINEVLINKMSSLLAHRGPDSKGIYINQSKRLGFIHRRLSVIDLSERANQPMIDSNGNIIVYNGEIYNFREIKSQLGLKNLKSNSDTEIILESYKFWGDDCVRYFKGMFSFAIWDNINKKLFCARDHFGIKPFYYYEDNNFIYFASEPKAILPFIKNISTNKRALKDYIVFQLYLSENILFDNIKQLPPSSTLNIKNGKKIIRKYWNLNFNIDNTHNSKYFIDNIRDLLESSVKSHLVGDLEIGAYVSGGIDSSSIASIANKYNNSSLVGFTGFFSGYGKSYDETEYADLLSAKNNFELFRLEIKPTDFIDNIEKVIYHLDTPIAGPGAFSQYMISKFSSKYRKVILGGQGGDEIFGGYSRYLIAYFEQCIKAAIDGTYKDGNFVVTYESIIPNLIQLKNYKPLIKHFWKEGLFDDMNERYFRLVNRGPSYGDLINWEIMENYSAKDEYKKVFLKNKINKNAYFDLMTNFDFNTLLPALLQVEDRMSMAHGVESRVPLLDRELVELSATIPADIKFKNGNTKNIFKKAVYKYLPSQIINRTDKMGFPTPTNLWFKKDLRTFILDIFNSKISQEREYINGKKLLQQMENENEFDRRIWGILSLELWHRQFIDKKL